MKQSIKKLATNVATKDIICRSPRQAVAERVDTEAWITERRWDWIVDHGGDSTGRAAVGAGRARPSTARRAARSVVAGPAAR